MNRLDKADHEVPLIRGSRNKDFLKEKEISEDEERQGEEEIQKLTDLFVEKVDAALEAKEKDLLDF